MGLNIGALGNFAGGVAKGISAYQEQALREKDAEMRQAQLEIEKEKQGWARAEAEDKEAYRKILGLSASPEGEAGTGVPLQQAISGLGQDKNVNASRYAQDSGTARTDASGKVLLEGQSTPPAFTEAGRQELLAKLQALPPEQAAKALQAYQSMYTQPEGGVDIGKAALYKDANGQLMATDKTVARTPEQQMTRLQELAKQSGNPYALEKAMDLETKQKQNKMADLSLSKAKREEKYNDALEKLSDKQVKILGVLDDLSKTDLQGAPEIINGELKGFGLTAKFVPATTVQSEEPTAFTPGKTALGSPAVVEVRDKKGNVVGSFGSMEEIKGALDSHVEDYNQKITEQVANLLPTAAERLKFRQDVKEMTIKQAQLGLEGRRTKAEEDRVGLEGKRVDLEGKRVDLEGERVKQEDRKIDALFQQVGFEGERVEIAKEQLKHDSSRLGMDAGKLGLEWAKFNLEVKDNPKKMQLMDAQIKEYNASANYRNAAAKSLGEKTGNWSVIGVDKDGAPISYNKSDGKAARADGKPIQDIEIFKKITGEKAPKEPISNTDMLKFLEQMGDAPSGIKDKNTGKDLRIRDLPLDQQKQFAEEFFQKGNGQGGLPAPNVANMPRPGADKTTASALPVDSKPRGQNVAPELQNQSSHKLYAADIMLQEAQKEADVAAASGDQQAIITAGNKLNAARAARDAAASSPLLPRSR